MYFDTNESSTHKKAKEKLFDLIVSKRIEIVDQDGNVYEIFKGKDETEFLHIESFVMDYYNQALFSNDKSPCQQHLSDLKKEGMCDAKGYYGAFKELPCEKCVSFNFRKYVKYSSKYASYRPDIAFGYKGEHKVWLEIKNESPCSENKIEFCKKYGITLLEINAADVIGFKDYNGKLMFNKLEEYIHVKTIYEEVEELAMLISNDLNTNEFVPFSTVTNFISDRGYAEQLIKFKRIFDKEVENKFYKVNVEGKDIKKYFGLKKKGTVLVKKEQYDKINELGLLKSNKPAIAEPSTSDRQVICKKCKGKSKAKDLVRVEGKIRNSRQTYEFYHEKCFNEI
ncbi:hypothetical protein [Bacillus infantis]|uniref:hypothetical protein n=1 Tax=Bacillus infantis TaxID=324767 RepID=UPI003CF4D714